MRSRDYDPVDTGCLAGAILRAWVNGDVNRLRAEWSRTMSYVDPEDNGVDAEHRLLLRSIVARMRRCRNLFAQRDEDPGLDLCIDLLAHLVSHQTPPVRLA